MQASGNHGRSNAPPPPDGIGNIVTSTAPQQSTRGFVAPTSTPVKKTPDITDIIGEQKAESSSSTSLTNQQKVENAEKNEDNADDLTRLPSSGLDFPTHWYAMFEHIFASVPTIYFPLKQTLPEIENNIIKITVKNEVQKEHFEAKTREALEYLRVHFNEQIEEIIVVADEQLETKKIIYDVKDKLQNFKEQNIEFDDFLQILDLKIKD